MSIEQREMTVRALVLTARDSGIAGKRLEIVTRERGRMVVFVPQGRRIRQRIGALLPGSRIDLTLRQDAAGWQAVQAEGRILVDVFAWSYEDWLCYYAYPAWLDELFPSEEEEPDLYRLTADYLSALATKHMVISTLIACWQAAVIAGYDPMVLAAKGQLPLDDTGREALRLMLEYPWRQAPAVTWSSATVMRLAQTLIYFSRYHVGIEVAALDELVKEKY